MEKSESRLRIVLDFIIRILGGYTKKEFFKYKETIFNNMKKIKLQKELSQDEKMLLCSYRTDILHRKGKARVNIERITENKKHSFF